MKIALLGLKGHHSDVLKGAKTLGNCEIVAVSEDDEAARAKFLKKEPLAERAQGYADWRHLVEHTMFDVALVCDENGRRAEQVLTLASRGVHIVAEKPLTTTLEDLARVRTAMTQSAGRLTMLLRMRFEPKYGAMRRLIQEGAIGDVCSATMQKSYRLETRDAWQQSRARLGGIIPFISIHAIDTVTWVLGQRYSHVSAFHSNIGTPQLGETEDQAVLAFRLAGGGSAAITSDFLLPARYATHGDDRLRICGSRGSIETAQAYPHLLLTTNDQPTREVSVEPSDNLFVDFVRAIEADKPPRLTTEDCYYATEISLKARQAADTRQTIAL